MIICTGVERDKNKNIISLTLLDTNTDKKMEMEKEKLKDLIKHGKLVVDNVQLTKDNKIRVLDSTISKYISSCNMLGIQSIDIENIGGKYIVVGLNGNRNVIIPKFVDGIHVSELLDSKSKLKPSDGIADKHILYIHNNILELCKQSNSMSRVIMDLKNTLKTDGNNMDYKSLHEKLDSILIELDKIKGEQEKQEEIIEKSLSAADSIIDKLDELNIKSESVNNSCAELKDMISQNGERLIQIKDKLSTELPRIEDIYFKSLQKFVESNDTSSMYSLPKLSVFIQNKEDNRFTSEDAYNDLMQKYFGVELIKFKDIGILKSALEHYYPYMELIRKSLETTDPSLVKDIKEAQYASSKKKNTRDSIHRALMRPYDAIRVIGNKTAGAGVSLAGSIFKMAQTEVVIDIKHKINRNAERRLNKDLDLVYGIYLSDDILESLFGSVDREIVTYMLEEKCFNINNNEYLIPVGNYVAHFENYIILKLFLDNMQIGRDTNRLHHMIYTDEIKKRIALAYICACKVVDGNIEIGQEHINLGIDIKPKIESCNILVNDALDLGSEDYEYDKNINTGCIRRLYFPIILILTFINMLILGFEANFACDVLGKMINIATTDLCGKRPLYNLKVRDCTRLKFDVLDYVNE